MAYRKITGERAYTNYKDCTKGDVLIEDGIFVGAEVNTTFGKYNFLFDCDGVTKVLNWAGFLGWHFGIETTTKKINPKPIKEGTLCKIVYEGKETIERGVFAGKDGHNFTIYSDESTVTDYLKTPSVIAAPEDAAADDTELEDEETYTPPVVAKTEAPTTTRRVVTKPTKSGTKTKSMTL